MGYSFTEDESIPCGWYKAFGKDLLKDTGVLLVPGEVFDTPGYARLGYCAPHETLTKGLEVLGDYLQAN